MNLIGVTKKFATLKADLRNVSRDTFVHKVSLDGSPYVEIWYKLVINIQTVRMIFSIEVKGKELGSVEAHI
jgi:hypothetical protein